MLRKTILLKYFKRENTPGKRLILLLFRRQCEELSSAIAPVSFKKDDFLTADIRIFFFSLNSEKFTLSIRGEDIEEHEANREKVIQELTDRGSN